MALTDPNDDGSGFFNWEYTGMPPLQPSQQQAPPGYHYGIDWTSNQLFPDDPNDPNTPNANGHGEGWMGVSDGALAGGSAAPTPQGAMPQQQAPGSYQPMAGWDAGKLNGDADTLKYQFGRWLQSSPFYNGGSGAQSRGNVAPLVNAWNSFSGGNAQASGDDGIDFGNGWNKVDLINGNGDGWQWGAYNDPNAQGTSSGTNSLSGLMGLSGGQYAQAPTAPTWTAMQANSSAYGQSPLATAQRRSPSTLAQLLGGQ